MSLLKKHHIVLTIAITICSTSALFGQYYFGRNKIQYNRFQWQILKTKHFDIYFYPEMEELAEIGAYLAEESYRHLQDKFNHNILQRIPLVFYSSHFHFEETNTLPYIIPPGVAGFFEYIKGRVVVPSDGSLSQFRKVIRHELVHVFQRSYVSRTLKDHRILRFKDAPLWFTEGLAEYWSEGWTTEAEMIIRDGVLHNTIVPIESMGWIWGTYIMYKEGQSILKFISDTYGEEKILQLLQNIWKEETFSKVMKITIGKDYKELSEEWLYYLKKSRFPMMEEKEFPRMVTTRLTEKGFNSLPSYYRDGDVPMVVFVANRDGYSSIYRKPVVKFKEKRPEILIKGERTPELESFHLQNSRIDVDSAGRLAFIAKSGPQDILNIFDIASKRIVQTYAFDDLVSLFSPSWSPDGAEVLFVSTRDGMRNLYTLDEQGTCRRRTRALEAMQDPRWLPSGREVLASVYHGERMHAAVITLGEGEVISSPTAAPGRLEPWTWQAEIDSIEAEEGRYRSSFALDVAQAGVAVDRGLGTNEGVQLLLRDLMGNRLMLFQLGNTTISTENFIDNFSASATYIDLSRRLNRGVSIFHHAGTYYDALRVPFFERRAGSQLLLSYPFSRFSRVETTFGLAFSEKEKPAAGFVRKGVLATHSISWIHDTSLWLHTGPIDGERKHVTLGMAMNLRRPGVEFVYLLADARRYLRLGHHSAMAFRLQGRLSDGPDPQIFLLGGTHSLRGYPRRALHGSGTVLANVELRFPMFRGFLLVPEGLGAIGLPGVQGALFLDAGRAWDDGRSDGWRGSYGLGFRMGLGGVLVLRLDFARRTDFDRWPNRDYTEFYLGWNY